MSYIIKMLYNDGSEELIEDEEYKTREAAEEMADYYCGCYREGGETLNMSNPGDYPLDEDDDCDYEIIEKD